METLRRWFLNHWFAAVFLLIGGLWLATNAAYLFGAGGLSVGNRYTLERATIDFDRKHDLPVLTLADGVGLQLDHGHASIVRVKPGLPLVFCWVCGRNAYDGGLAASVAFRDGDWLYRAPTDLSRNSEVQRGRAASRDYIRTLAYNRVTGERVMPDGAATVEVQAAELAARGLVVRDEHRLAPAALTDLTVMSMQREGCVVFNAAFVLVTLLWAVLGGIALGIARLVRRRRVRLGA